MGKTRAECSQNAYTSAFLSHWIQILANSSPKSDIFNNKKKKKNRPCFFAFYGRSGEGNITKKNVWPYGVGYRLKCCEKCKPFSVISMRYVILRSSVLTLTVKARMTLKRTHSRLSPCLFWKYLSVLWIVPALQDNNMRRYLQTTLCKSSFREMNFLSGKSLQSCQYSKSHRFTINLFRTP